jgi:penicillin-binding protein 2
MNGSNHDPAPRRRPLGSQIVVGLLLALLAVKVVDLQVTRAQEMVEASERNRLRRVRIPPPRGEIYDRRGAVLATNEAAYAVGVISPPDRPPAGARLQRLCDLLDLDPETLLGLFETGRSYPYEPAILVPDADAGLVTRVAEAGTDELVVVSRPRRVYPQGETLCHVLGYTDEVRPEELSPRYRMGDLIGRRGLEAVYEAELAGRPGVRFIEVNALERRIGASSRTTLPASGNHLVLSVDLALQRRAEEILAELTYKRPYDWPEDEPWVEPEPGLRGSIVLMDTRTGEVYALATRPGYDPNRVGVRADPAYWGGVLSDPQKPLLARAYQSTYPPGSAFKLVDATAGLMLGKVASDVAENPARDGKKGEGPSSYMDQPCGGVFYLGDTAFHCWGHVGHGRLPLSEAIGWSCNVYFYQLGLRIGIEGIAEYGHLYGLDEPTGIDLPHERTGRLPSVERLEERWGERWPRGQICNNAIGQGDVLVSPVGMLSMYAAIANGGTLLAPRLVKRVVAPDGSHLREVPRAVRGGIELPAWVHETLVQGMRNVLRRFGANPHDLCGKTGTAENPHGEPHAWFCGFAPSTDPRVAVVIMIENGGFGESYIRYAKELVGYVLDEGLGEREPVSCLDFEAIKLARRLGGGIR